MKLVYLQSKWTKKKTCQNSPKEKFQSEMSLVKSCLAYFIQFSLFFFTGQVSKMDTISFGALCDFMEDLRESKENKKKIGKLSRFLAKCRDTLSKDNNDTDLFPIIRLLVPQLDRERGSYGSTWLCEACEAVVVLTLSPRAPHQRVAEHVALASYPRTGFWYFQVVCDK